MIADVRLFVGKGLYTVSEAARYARISPRMMRRWLFGDAGKGAAVVRPEVASAKTYVSFLDLVQTLAIRAIRRQKRVPLQRIREAMTTAQKYWGMRYPFAMQHTTFLWNDTIVVSPPEKDPDEMRRYVEASGKYRGNVLLKPIVEIYLQDLHYDPITGLADRYTVFAWGDVPGIEMDPRRRFGEPLLPSGYSARTIVEAVEIEGGIDEAASAYRIDRREVQLALRFFLDYLPGKLG